MNWKTTLRHRRARAENREPVPKVVATVTRVKEEKAQIRYAVLAGALVISFLGHIIFFMPSTGLANRKDKGIMGITAVRSAVEDKKEEELPPELEAPKEYTVGEGVGAGEDASKVPGRNRLEDVRAANSAGILGALDQGNESMDRLFDGTSLGAELDDRLNGVVGLTGADLRGQMGLGSRGAGMGGGGSALGIGGLGTAGRGGGRGGGLAYGVGAAGNLSKRSSNINIDAGGATIEGSLDKSIIARIIKKHFSQIRYCYQKELNKNPKLYGKITIKFTISPEGTVSSSFVNVTTMKNFQVEQCVANTIKRIIFPRPKGGGIVVVIYPFIFKAEGT